MDPATHEEWSGKLRVLLIAVALLFSILLLRLFHLQITTFADYAKESEDNRIHQKRVKAPRGRILDRHGQVLATNRASYTIFLIPSTAQRNAETVTALGDAIGARISYSGSPKLKRDVNFKTVCIVEERLMDDWPLAIEIEPQRLYPFGSLAAHVLGYIGEMQEEDALSRRAGRYAVGDYVGKTGVEERFEDYLRGQDGVRYIEVDARTRIIDPFPFPERERAPVPGRDLELTLDLELQQAAEQALPDTLAGSVIAIDARDGAVLAMVSKPWFNPNVFVSFQSQDERRRLFDSEDDPLVNRSVQGLYPPGSTLKMVASVAALEAEITDTLSTFAACAGSLQVGDVVFRCFNREGHGELNLLEATETSCNIYFNHLAQILGMDAWREAAAKLGFGEVTGIRGGLKEAPGLLPSKQWYIEREGGWVTGHLMNLVIGQGAMLATPLQMARYVAALGNGGYLVTPHVRGPAPEPIEIDGLSENTLEIIGKSMLRVVYGEHGTGRRARVKGIQVAGKSGTAQVPRSNDDAWFVAFAPYEEPEIAVAVVVEGGGGGGAVAAPVVGEVMRAYFSDRLVQRRSISPKAPRAEPPAEATEPAAQPAMAAVALPAGT